MVRRTPSRYGLTVTRLAGWVLAAGAAQPIPMQRAERCRSALRDPRLWELRRVRSFARGNDDLPKLAVLLFRYSAIMQDMTDEGSGASTE